MVFLNGPRVAPLAALALLVVPALASALLPAAPLAPADPRAAAAALYGDAPLELRPLSDPDLALLLPGHALYEVSEASRMPMVRHAMALDSLTGAALDVTRGFDALLAGLGPLSGADALRAGRAYARLADPELLAEREVVGAADAARLGLALADPAVDGREVRLHTWSRENGVVAAWTLLLGPAGLREASWTVVATGRGDFHPDWEAVNLREGVRVVDRHGPAGFSQEAWLRTDTGETRMTLPDAVDDLPFHVVTERTSFDGSRWVAQYPSVDGVETPVGIVEVAKAVTEAGAGAYDLQVARNPLPCANVTNPADNWGFESRDPDCVLEVRLLEQNSLLCIACITGGDHVRIYYAPYAKEFLYANGFFQDLENHDPYVVADTIIGHEHFHNLQYVVTRWSPGWSAYIEGQARFEETVHAPGVNQHPTSGWYVNANGYQRSPSGAMCSQSYNLAPWWGYLYWKDGGIATIKRVLEEVAGAAGPCETGLPAAITRALAASPGLHDSHEAALADFGAHPYSKEMTWGTHDGAAVEEWGTHLVNVTMLAQTSGRVNRSVSAYGLQYTRLPAHAFTVQCDVTDAGWAFRLLYRDADGDVTSEPLACGSAKAVDGAAHAQVVLNAVRASGTLGRYLTTVT